MLEIALIVGLVVVIAKIADNEGLSAFLWGAITVVANILCMLLLPWAFLRVLAAGVLVFVVMTAANAIKARRS